MCVVLCASCICVALVGTNVCSPVCILYLCWWELMCVVLCASCICVVCVVLCASCVCVALMGTNVCNPVCFLYLCWWRPMCVVLLLLRLGRMCACEEQSGCKVFGFEWEEVHKLQA